MVNSATPYTTDYAQAIKDGKALFDKLILLDGWNKKYDKDDIRTYTRHDEKTGLKLIRGEGVVRRPLKENSDPLILPGIIIGWDDGLYQSDFLDQDGDYELIRSVDQKKPFLTQRETILAFDNIKMPDNGILRLGVSCSQPKYPPRPEYVHAHIPIYAWLFTPDKEDPNKTHVVYILFLDPRGNVPKAVFNAFINEQAMNFCKQISFIEIPLSVKDFLNNSSLYKNKRCTKVVI